VKHWPVQIPCWVRITAPKWTRIRLRAPLKELGRRHHSHTSAAKAAHTTKRKGGLPAQPTLFDRGNKAKQLAHRPLRKSVAVEIRAGVTHVARSPSCRSTPTRPAMATPSSSASGSSSSPGAAYSSGSASPYSSRIWYRIISALASPAGSVRALLPRPRAPHNSAAIGRTTAMARLRVGRFRGAREHSE
jgi:hypothetical protein